VSTSFTPILNHTLEQTPGALAAIFADADGEAVDSVSTRLKPDDLLVLGAHYGVLLSMMRSGLTRFALGRPEEILIHHSRTDVLIREVGDGYYVVLALDAGSHLATAQRRLDSCAAALRKEM